MKRPVTLAFVATLLASTSAFAAGNPYMTRHVAEQVVRNDDRRDNDHRDHRDHGNRGGDHRGNHGDNDRHDDHRSGEYRHDNDRRDNDRHDWNDHRDDHRYDRPRHDNDRHDWNDHRDANRHDWNGNRGWDRPRSDWSNHPNYWDNRSHDRRDYARYRYHFGSYRAPYGYQYRSWHRGDYLPRSYYDRSYIVYDWRPYRLYEPPYGYHWVRVGNDVLLTALATGVVLDVLYDIWY